MPNPETTDQLDRLGDRLKYLLLELRRCVHPLTQQGEDRIWRAAEKACQIIDEAEEELARASKDTSHGR